MAKARPAIICSSCGNLVAHLYLAERGGETILACSDCKAKGD
jgi:formylmethanofuran dehydrogenase subunit E